METKNKLCIVGDIHGHIPALEQLIKKENPNAIICVGDLSVFKDLNSVKSDKAFKKNNYTLLEKVKKFEIPIYVVKGNHDDFNNMYSDEFKEKNIFYLQQGEILHINNLKIISLGGIWSPKYILKNSETFIGREKRFFTNEEINNIINYNLEYDILITHAAAKGFLPNYINHEGIEELKFLLDNIKTKWYIYGHHHKNFKTIINNINVVGLGNFKKNNKSYIIF